MIHKSVTLYGVDHSPWVQGVWYALSFTGYKVKLTSIPPSLNWVLENGITFPVLKLSSTHIIKDSFTIYKFLSKHNSQVYFPDDYFRHQMRLEKLFLNYSILRAPSKKNLKFFGAWLGMRERPYTLNGSIFRSFLFFYYFLLIKLGRLFYFRKYSSDAPYQNITQELRYWDNLLESNKYITGEKLSFVDFALFGHIECMASGPTDELLHNIRKNQNLLRWIEDMIKNNPNYGPLFSKRLFYDNHAPHKSLHDQFLFLFGCVIFLLFLPISISGVIILLLIRKKGNHFSGAKVINPKD